MAYIDIAEQPDVNSEEKVVHLIKKFKEAKDLKDHWKAKFEEAYEYCLPNRESFYTESPGDKRTDKIFDETAVVGVQEFASRLQAGITPTFARWADFQAGSDIPDEAKPQINLELDTITNYVFEVIQQSNFNQEVHEAFMDLAVGTGVYTAAFFHLLTHAMFKANLFYGSGSVIHAMHHALHEKHDHETDPQNMHNMGGFKERMPITYWSMLLSTMAIAGIPLFSGFLSKDAILAGTLSFAQHHPIHFLLPIFGFGAAAITAFYMFRMMFLTFHGKPKMPELIEDINESPKEMTGPLVLLGGLSFFIWYTLPYFDPMSTHGWFTDLVKPSDAVVPGNLTAEQIEDGAHHAHYLAMYVSIGVAALGIFLSWFTYIKKGLSAEAWSRRAGFLYDWSLNKYYFDENYDRFIYQPSLRLSKKVAWIDWELYDKYFINGFGRLTSWASKVTGKFDFDVIDQLLVDGTGRIAALFGRQLKTVQTGKLQNYVLYVTAGIIILMIIQSF